MTKPRIKEVNPGLFTCIGNCQKQYGVTPYKAYCAWKAVTNRQAIGAYKYPSWQHSIKLDSAA